MTDRANSDQRILLCERVSRSSGRYEADSLDLLKPCPLADWFSVLDIAGMPSYCFWLIFK